MRIKNNEARGFTLIELLVVIAILAILVVAALFIINPVQLESQGRDSNRESDLTTLSQDIAVYHETNPGGSLGVSGVIYISIPDPSATTTAGDQCQGLGLQALPAGWSYQCAPSSTYTKVDGTGWIPINFNLISGKNLLAKLPTDPINTTTSCEYYTYTAAGKNYEISGRMESQKNISLSTNDGGQYSDLYEAGSSLSLLVTDIGGGTIWSVSTSQNALQEFGACTEKYLTQITGSGGNALSRPYAVTIGNNGEIYVLNYNNGQVDVFDLSGDYISQFGSAGTGNGQFTNTSGGMAINSSTGDIYIADSGDSRVEIFGPNGNYISQFGVNGGGPGQFNGTGGIAINPLNGNVDVADYYNSRVEVWSATGTYISQFGYAGNGYASGTLGDPIGVADNSAGDVYVTNACPVNRVDEFDANGNWLARFGSTGSGNGQFNCPYGIAIGSDGKIYVADSGNNRIEVFDQNGNYLSQFAQTDPTFISTK